MSGIRENANVSIPNGFRELDNGEEMQESDMYFDAYSGLWKGRENSGDGYGYRKNVYYTTIRKIEEAKQMIKRKKCEYRFFLDTNKTVIFACTIHGGYYFSLHTKIISNEFTKSNTTGVLLSLSYHYSEIYLEDLNQYFNKEKLNQIYRTLKIPMEKINITEEQKQEIVQILQSSRAFNEDSAMQIEGKEDLCYQLADEGTLNSHENRFFIQKCL